MKALLRAPAKRYVAQNYSPQFLRTLMPLFSACEKVTDREYFVAKPRPKVENLPIGNAACRRFTRWRTHLERVCVKPFRHCTDGRQCARCQGGSASGLGRTHGAGPRTQDGIRVAPAISTLSPAPGWGCCSVFKMCWPQGEVFFTTSLALPFWQISSEPASPHFSQQKVGGGLKAA